jgi:hypothetical protein
MISSRSVIALASDGGDPMRLSAIVRESPHLISALEAARDVDLALFDAADLAPTRERSVRLELLARAPDLPWVRSDETIAR